MSYEHTYDPGVPFPRTVPRDAPEPPSPLLDQRAARAFFLNRVRAGTEAVAYRLSADGVVITHLDGHEAFAAWADVVRFARELRGFRGAEQDDDPSRREQRQQRRQDRRDERGGG